jgi:hypothetical protein
MLSKSDQEHPFNRQTSFSAPIRTLLRFLLSGIVVPDAIAYEPLEILLNAEDEAERDDLTRRWRDHKLEELNFVGIAVSRCLAHGFGPPRSKLPSHFSGVTSPTFSRDNLLSMPCIRCHVSIFVF